MITVYYTQYLFSPYAVSKSSLSVFDSYFFSFLFYALAQCDVKEMYLHSQGLTFSWLLVKILEKKNNRPIMEEKSALIA